MTREFDDNPHFYSSRFHWRDDISAHPSGLPPLIYIMSAFTNSGVFSRFLSPDPAAVCERPLGAAAGPFCSSMADGGGPKSRRLPRIMEQCLIGGMAT